MSIPLVVRNRGGIAVKRTATVVSLAIGMALAGAGTALAKNYPPTPGGNSGGNIGGAGGSGGNVAFTGANVTLGMVLVAALVVVGVVALFIGRRRARA
jgi:hypothetical protein